MLHLLKSNQVQAVKEIVANLNLTLIQLGYSNNTLPPPAAHWPLPKKKWKSFDEAQQKSMATTTTIRKSLW